MNILIYSLFGLYIQLKLVTNTEPILSWLTDTNQAGFNIGFHTVKVNID